MVVIFCFLGETFSAYTKTEQYKIQRFQMCTNLTMIFVFLLMVIMNPPPTTTTKGRFKTLLRKIFENI